MSAHTPGPWILHDYGTHYLVNNDTFGVEVPCFAGMANARLIAAAPDLLAELRQEVEVLERLANRCDAWATDSANGGWSTHQVEANRATADECRRRAAGIRTAIAKATGKAVPE